MADQLQLRGGTTAEHATFTGALREVTVDTDKDTVVVHDNATAGGHPLAKENLSNVSAATAATKLDGQTVKFGLGAAATPSVTFNGDLNTGVYSPGADQVAISTGGSGKLFINSAGEVDVSSANARLYVTTTGTNNAIATLRNASYYYNINLDGTSGALTFYNGTERLRITSDGKVGVGTSSPNYDLHINNSSIPRIQLTNSTSGSTATDGVLFYLNGSDAFLVNRESASLYLGSANTTALTIDSSQRVGIGTSSPSNNLHIVGDSDGGRQLRLSGGTNNAMIKVVSSSRTYSVGVALSDFGVYDDTAGAFRLLINSSGNVGIGTASPGRLLQVSSTSSDPFISIIGGATNNGGLLFGDNVSDAVGQIRYDHVVDAMLFNTNGAERARLDSAGRWLLGTSTARSVGGLTNQVQVEGVNAGTYSQSWVRNVGGTGGATICLGKSRSGSVGGVAIVNNNDQLGGLYFLGADGVDLDTPGAFIEAYVDGTPGTDDMPGRLVFSTTADGASSPTEQLRITNDGVRGYNQAAPVAVDATATLTVANLKNGIITSTTAAAVTGTLPTGTLTEGGFSGLYNNFTFEWTVINTGATNNFTVAAGTAHTVVGNMVVAAGNSGRFATRRTAANTFVTYRLSS